jgi:hypothetical protein
MTDPNYFGAAFGPQQMQSTHQFFVPPQPRMPVQQFNASQPQYIHAIQGPQGFGHYYSQVGAPSYSNMHAMGQPFVPPPAPYTQYYHTNVQSGPPLYQYMNQQQYSPSSNLPPATASVPVKQRQKNILQIVDPKTKQEVDLTSNGTSPVDSIVSDVNTPAVSETSPPPVAVKILPEDIKTENISIETKEESSLSNLPLPDSSESLLNEQKTPVNGFLESHEVTKDIHDSEEVNVDDSDDNEEVVVAQSYLTKPEIYRYTQQEMLNLRKLPSCLKAPLHFPDIPGVTLLHDLDMDDIASMDQQVESMIKMMRGSDSYRGVGRTGGQMNRRYPQTNLNINLQHKDVGFREASSVYKPLFKLGSMESHQEQLKRKIRALLNKLTPENFNKIQEKIYKLEIKTTDDLMQLCSLIFEKATNEKSYATVFAKLCSDLANQLSVADEEDTKTRVYFRQPLIKFCQIRFETKFEDYMKEQEIDIEKNIEEEKDERTKAILLSNKQDQLRKRELQYYGNMKFIGELLRLQLLKPAIFFYCTQQLMIENNTALDCLCELYTTVGELVDVKSQKAQNHMAVVFKFVEEQTKNEKLESRIRFKLLDLIELRQRGWKKRDLQLQLQSGPKTLAEMQEVSRKEEDEKAKVLRAVQRSFKDTRIPSNSMSQQSRHSFPQNQRNIKPGSMVLTSHSAMDANSAFLGPPGASSRWASGSGGGKQKPQDDRKGDTSVESWRTAEEKKGRQQSMRQDYRNRPASPVSTSNRFSTIDYFNSPKASSTHSSGHSTPTLQQQIESSLGGSISSQEAKIATGRSSPTPSASEDSASVRDRNEQDVFTNESLKRKAEWAIPEYISTGVLEEGYYAIPLQYHAFYINQLINCALENSDAIRTATGEFLGKLVENGIFSDDALNEGINLMINQCVEYELETDIPDFWKYMGTILEGLIRDENSRLVSLANLNAESLNLAKLWSQLLHSASQRLTPRVVSHVFRASDLSWEKLLPGYDVSSFIEKENLQFTVKDNISDESSPSPLRDTLRTMEDENNEAVFDVIDTHLQSDTTLADVLSAIVEFVLSAALKSTSSVFESRLPILKRYSTSDSEQSKMTEDIIVSTLKRLRSESNSRLCDEVLVKLDSNGFISRESLLKFSERTS